ncbi:alpha/beta fold hydrolase [Jatrophihabitans telluris]|uniref:Alpha/beta fold hydrolase n=1 Tax=Jatrophihabitans telluris TaxID=2038343 RepID=A0ABY4R1D4_9ACTN|nr:alpha/beta fold hydrolase [Jatrophihabitans telluris]UQX89573.1 alpha/beta fold hydrolase [Jatrophihabitans telluris]
MTPAHPTLSVSRASRGVQPRAVVLVLHGGREIGHDAVSPLDPAVLRMLPIARRIRRMGAGQLAVARLRYQVRGWNGALASPVADAEWAVQELSRRYPGLPIGLVGHSMGGRTALRVAGAAPVRSVVGLAPWLPPGEPLAQLSGRRVLLVHGDADRMTSPKGSAFVAAQLRADGIDAAFVAVPGERHAMLRRPRLWSDLAAGYLVQTLLTDAAAGESSSPRGAAGRPPSGQSVGRAAANLLRQVAEGEPRVTA